MAKRSVPVAAGRAASSADATPAELAGARARERSLLAARLIMAGAPVVLMGYLLGGATGLGLGLALLVLTTLGIPWLVDARAGRGERLQ